MQRQQGGHDEHDVAHAEDVAHRPRGRDGEDVAQKGQVRGRPTTLGCDQAQGYSFSRALPQADFAAWLTARELSELALSA